MIIDLNTKIRTLSWIYNYIKKTLLDLIFKIYFSISTILLTIQYLIFCTILAIVNIDVTWLNNLIFEMMREKW